MSNSKISVGLNTPAYPRLSKLILNDGNRLAQK
jgi:hypothetical protein